MLYKLKRKFLIQARAMDLINSDFALKTIIDEFNDYRAKLGELYTFDWISIPLVYTQAVGIAVYGFFISTLLGRQVLCCH